MTRNTQAQCTMHNPSQERVCERTKRCANTQPLNALCKRELTRLGPHGYRLTCLGGSLSVPAPHSLRTAHFGAVGPTCQSGGSCVCRAALWLAIGLHTVQGTAEACLAAAGLMYCEFGCMLASYGAPTVLEACIEHCRGCVSGGLRSQNGTCSLYQ